VIIFDDEPFRNWYSTSYLKYEDHWNEENCFDYLSDLIEVFSKKNFKIAIKLKKFNTKKTTKKYLKFINDNKFNLIFIDPKFSSIEIVRKVKLVISFPFSSTALLAKKQNIDSIYYFPLKLENKPLFDEDIKIIEGKKELLNYLHKIKI
jgi:polysaccharide biosynthesis PFTS motif protein